MSNKLAKNTIDNNKKNNKKETCPWEKKLPNYKPEKKVKFQYKH